MGTGQQATPAVPLVLSQAPAAPQTAQVSLGVPLQSRRLHRSVQLGV